MRRKWQGGVGNTREGLAAPEKWGVQDGRPTRSGRNNNHQPVRARPRKKASSLSLWRMKVSHAHSEGGLKTG